MTGPLYYPKADRKAQWFYDPNQGVEMPMDHVKWVQHTTETDGGWPSYSGGSICPTLTYEPWLHEWHQHLPINRSARALQNDGPNYTNRVDVVQTEISCVCDRGFAARYGYTKTVDKLDAQAIDDLGDFAEWLAHEWGMALDFHPLNINWPAYDGQQPFPRMTWDNYVGFSGILGHIAVPGNSHLDPGDLDNIGILTRAKGQSAQRIKFPLVDAAAKAGFDAVHSLEAFQAALAKVEADKLEAVVGAKAAAPELLARTKHQTMLLHQVNFPPK